MTTFRILTAVIACASYFAAAGATVNPATDSAQSATVTGVPSRAEQGTSYTLQLNVNFESGGAASFGSATGVSWTATGALTGTISGDTFTPSNTGHIAGDSGTIIGSFTSEAADTF